MFLKSFELHILIKDIDSNLANIGEFFLVLRYFIVKICIHFKIDGNYWGCKTNIQIACNISIKQI